MTSSNGKIYRVTGNLWGESTGYLCIPSQRPLTRSFDVLLHLRLWTNGWANNLDAGDLIRHRVHYDVSVMTKHNQTLCIIHGTYFTQNTDSVFSKSITERPLLRRRTRLVNISGRRGGDPGLRCMESITLSALFRGLLHCGKMAIPLPISRNLIV